MIEGLLIFALFILLAIVVLIKYFDSIPIVDGDGSIRRIPRDKYNSIKAKIRGLDDKSDVSLIHHFKEASGFYPMHLSDIKNFIK